MWDQIKYFLELLTSISIILGVVFSYMQIKKISKSVDIGEKANLINVLNYFTREYDSLMMEMTDCADEKKVERWYFRFWNLFTNEFLFFNKGLLDSIVFEFWAYKVCLYYDKKPSGIPSREIDTYRQSHLKYIVKRKGSYPKADMFFKELMKISEKEKDKNKIEKQVHGLLKKYRDKKN